MTEAATPLWRRRRVQIGVGAAVVALAGVAAGLALALGGGGGGSLASKPVGLLRRDLSGAVAALRQPVYWVGARDNRTYEVSRTDRGLVYLRYLPPGVEAGDPRSVLTVGTYPMAQAFPVTRSLANAPGAVTIPVGNGAVAFYTRAKPTSVYVAYAGSDYQVEVYAPTAGLAQALVADGDVAPVSGSSVNLSFVIPPRAVTAAELRTLRLTVHHPIYWAGARPPSVHEITLTAGGSTYLRYLPPGVRVGSKKPYLTVGTYPLKGAFAATQTVGRKPGFVLQRLPGGAVAASRKAGPVSVYVSYPGSDLQIEVYDPKPGEALALVRAGRIVAAP